WWGTEISYRTRPSIHDAFACDVRVPPSAVLDDPTLGHVVDVDETEALRVPLVPFIVVEERPREVATQVDARVHGTHTGRQVAAVVVEALAIVHCTRCVGTEVVCSAVFGDHQRAPTVFPLQAEEESEQRVRAHLPSDVGAGGRWGFLDRARLVAD